MAHPDSYLPEPITSTPQALPPVSVAAYELRPLSLGEILDRTFSIYRSRFWLFAGICSVSAGLQTLLAAIQLLPMSLKGFNPGAPGQVGAAPNMSPGAAAGLAGGVLIGAIVFGLLYLFAFAITQAATVFALSEVYLGRPVTIAESVKKTIGKWYRQIGISIWQSFSMMWIPMSLLIVGVIALSAIPSNAGKILGIAILVLAVAGGVPVGVVLWLRNMLAVQATVIEGLPVRASMKRSKVLTSGAKGRIFVVLLLAAVLSYVASLLEMPLMMFVMFTVAKGGQAIGSELIMLLVGFVGRTVVSPVLMIGLSLVYFDQRVRKEALDLVMLMGSEQAVPAVPIAPEFDWGYPVQPMPMQVGTPYSSAVASAEPAAQAVAESPEEDAGHAGDAPIA